ncbi:Uncharacterised protein [Escherichia coli]|nr:Uncharacterised protein [Escherichia coli]
MLFRVYQKSGREMHDARLLCLPVVRAALWQLVTDFTVHTDHHGRNSPIFAERTDDTGHQVVSPGEKEQTVTLLHLTDNRIPNLPLFRETSFHRTVVVDTLHVVVKLLKFKACKLSVVRVKSVARSVQKYHKAAKIFS